MGGSGSYQLQVAWVYTLTVIPHQRSRDSITRCLSVLGVVAGLLEGSRNGESPAFGFDGFCCRHAGIFY